MNISEKINQLQFQKYSAYLKSQGLSDATIKRKLSSLSSFQKFLIKKKFLVTQSTSPVLNPSVLRTAPLDKGAQFNPFKNFKFKIVNYVAIATVLILLSGLGYTVYSQTILQARKNLAYSTASNLTTPNRILSFQGRLTDSSGNPITSSTGIVFRLFNSGVGGTQLYVSDTGNSQTVVPDENGIFSVVIGKSHGLGIPSSVFSENAEVWLEITAGGETMDPRQQIATVGYALNAETLQGLPPSASGTKDTVLVIDGLGNINLGETSPSIISTSGTFGLEGQAVLIKASDTSGGNITINPDGAGILKLITEGSASPAIGGFIEATNANLATGNLFSGLIRNDNRSYNFIDFTNFDVGTTQLSTRFSVDASGTVTTSIGITAPKITLSVGASSGYILQSDANGNSTWVNPGSAGIGTSYDAGSGLTKTGSVFKFGGVITENTRLNIGNTEVLYINSANGRVGIGTTDTSYKVNIAGGDIALDNYRNIYWGSGATQSYLNVSSGFYRFYYNAVERLKFDLNASTTHSILDMTANLSLGTSATNTDLIFNPNRNAYMYSGNFGLGTTSPTYKLEVVGSNNIFRIGDTAGNTLFSVTDSAITSNLPTTFNSSGDVSMAYNLIFTNPTQSTIKSSAPLSIEAGEVFGSSNLSLKTYNSGNVIVDSQKLVIGGTLTYSQGAQNGYLLQSDANGNATWVTASGIGGTYTATNGLTLTGSSFGLGGTLTQNTNIGTSSFKLNFISSSGSQSLSIGHSSGFLGVGTTNPNAMLSVQGINGNVNIAQFQNDDDRVKTKILGDYGTYYGGFYNQNDYGYSFDYNGNIRLGLASGLATNLFIDKTTGASSIGGTAASTAPYLFISGTGNVGIGTTAPSKKLDVAGDINLTGTIFSNGTSGSSGQVLSSTGTGLQWVNASSVGGTYVFSNGLTNNGTFVGLGGTLSQNTNLTIGNTSAFFINSTSGYIGIGTSNPTESLTSTGSVLLNATSGRIKMGNSNPYIDWNNASGLTVGFNNDVQRIRLENTGTYIGGITFQTNSLQRMLINSSGNVGIGTTNPTQALTVSGNILLPNPGGGTDRSISINVNGGNEKSYLRFDPTIAGRNWDIGSIFANNTYNFGIQEGTNPAFLTITHSTGNVGIGTTAPSKKLDVAGDINLTGTIFTTGTSGTSGQVLSSTGTGLQWVNASSVGGTYVFSNGLTNNGTFVGLGGTLTQNTNLTVGNTSALFINSTSGYIGIGTTNPGYLLNITDSSANTDFVIDKSGGALGKFMFGGNTEASATREFSLGVNSSILSMFYYGNDFRLGTKTADNLRFYTNNLERFRIDGTGNVGIGTTAPSKKLDVAGDINLTGTIFSNGTSGTSGQVLSSTGTGLQWVNASSVGGTYTANNGLTLTGSNFKLGGELVESTRLNIGNTEVMYFNTSGNVGIGTTSPGVKLDVVGGSMRTDGGLSMTGSSGIYWNSNIDKGVYPTTSSGNQINYSTFDSHVWKTYSGSSYNEKMRLTQSGNVGIGTTAPGALLHVAGTAYINTAVFTNQISGYNNGGSINLNANNIDIQTATDDYISLTTRPSGTLVEQVRITSTGSVGIGTTAPSKKLDVVGDINLTGTIFSNGTSGTSGQVLTSTGTGLQWVNASSVGGTYVFSNGLTNNGTFVGLGGTLSQNTQIGTSSFNLTFMGLGNTIGLFQSNTGLVGIGTTDISSILTLASLNTTQNQLQLRSSRSAIAVGNIIGGIEFNSSDTNLGIGGTTVASIQAIATTTHAAPTLDTALIFNTVSGTTPAEVMRLSANGNVGIGTTAPTQKFQVNSIGTSVFTVTTTGNVGIGTTSPASKLQIIDNTITSGMGLNIGSSSITSGQMIRLTQSTSTMNGAGLYMDFGIGSTAAFTGNYLDLRNTNTSLFNINYRGGITQNYTTPIAGEVNNLNNLTYTNTQQAGQNYYNLVLSSPATTITSSTSTGTTEPMDAVYEGFPISSGVYNRISGVRIRLRRNEIVNNSTTSYIRAQLFADVGGTPSGSALANSSSLYYYRISNTFANYDFNLSYNVSVGTTYWVIIQRVSSNANDIIFETANTGVNQWASSPDSTSWTVETGKKGYYYVYTSSAAGLSSTSYNGTGVAGYSTSGYGVYGVSAYNAGVAGVSTNNYALIGTGAYGLSLNINNADSYGINVGSLTQRSGNIYYATNYNTNYSGSANSMDIGNFYYNPYYFIFSGGTFVDKTFELKYPGGLSYSLIGDTSSYFYVSRNVAHSSYSNLFVSLSNTPNLSGVVWEYSTSRDGVSGDCNGWTVFTPPRDETSGFSRSGLIDLTTPTNATLCKVNGSDQYWRRASATSVTTAPTSNSTNFGNFTGFFERYIGTGTEKYRIDYNGSQLNAGYIYPGNASYESPSVQSSRYIYDQDNAIATNTNLLTTGGNLQAANTSLLASEKALNRQFTTTPDTNWVWGSGWTHDTTSFEADHSIGTTQPVEQMAGIVPGEMYLLTYTVKNTSAGSIYAQVGGSNGRSLSNNQTYSQVITATNGTNLKFFPTSAFNGSIDDVSLRRIVGGNAQVAGLYTGGGPWGIKVDANGNVGIGSSTPLQQLNITNDYWFNRSYYYNGSSYTNNINESQSTQGTPFTILANTSDYYYVGRDSYTSDTIQIGIASTAVGIGLSAEYWNGSAWANVAITDGTNNLSRSGTISFTMPSDIATTTVNSATSYYIRLKTTSTPSSVPTAYFITPTSRDPLAIYANTGDATPSLYVNKYGTLGIGNTGDTRFAINTTGHLNLTGTIFTAGTSGASGQVLTSTGTGLQWVNASSVGGTYVFSNGLTNSGAFVGLGGTLTQNTTINTNGFNLNIGQGNTQALFISANGSVGIGTTNPSSTGFNKLDVNGAIASYGQSLFTYSVGGSKATFGDIYSGDGLFNTLEFRTNDTTQMVINSTGNLGIGTTNPTQKLDINGSINIGGSMTLTGSSIGTGTTALFVDANGLVTKRALGAGAFTDGIGTTYSATNGLTLSSGAFGLGGTLTSNTTINTSGFNLNIGQGNTQALFISASGNVGIGTTNPGFPLDIVFSNTSYSGFRVTNTNAGSSAQVQNQLVNNTGALAYYGISSSNFSGFAPLNSGKAFFGSNAVDTSIFTQSANDIIFSTNAVENMRIKSGGNIGIGTTAPSKKLDVAGDINLTGTIFSNGTSGTSGQVLSSTGTGLQWVNASSVGGTYTATNGLTLTGSAFGLGGTLTQNTNLTIGNTSVLFLGTNGNVGIGTTDPTSKLTVDGSITPQTNVTGGSLGSASKYWGSSYIYGLNLSGGAINNAQEINSQTYNLSILGGAGKTLSLGSNGIAGQVTLNSGNLGIGTTAPSKKLDVAGDINLTGTIFTAGTSGTSGQILSSTGTGLQWVNASSVGGTYTATNGLTLTGSNFKLGGELVESTRLNIGSTEVIYFNTSGNVGIGNTSPGTFKLNVTGNIVANNTGDGGKLSSTRNGSYEIYLQTSNQQTSRLHTQYGFWIEDASADRLFSYDTSITQPIISLNENNRNYDTWIKGNSNTLFYGDASTGNVGIGTTAPSKKLDVVGDINLTGTIFSNGTSGTSGQVLSSTGTGLQWVNATGLGQTYSADNGLHMTGNVVGLGGSLNGNTNIDTSGFNLNIGQGNTQALFISNGGNVGIGTTAPGTKLDVSGIFRTSGLPFASQVFPTTGVGFEMRYQTDYDALANLNTGGSGASVFQSFDRSGGAWKDLVVKGNNVVLSANGGSLILNGGNVGIGTTAPSKKLDVVGDINLTGTIFSNGTSGTSGQVLTSTGTGLQWVNASSVGQTYSVTNGLTMSSNVISLGGTLTQNTSLTVGNTSVLFLGTNGNVGIGTTSPTSKLHINGDLSFDGASGGAAAYLRDTGSTALRLGSTNTSRKVQMELYHAVNPVSLGVSYNAGAAEAYIESVHASYDNNTNLIFKPGGTEIWRVAVKGSGATTPYSFNITPTSNNYDFQLTNSSSIPLLRMDTSTGNLGIGTTAPSKKLDVTGDINLTGTIFSNGTSGTSGQILSSTGTGLQWIDASGVGTTKTYYAGTGLSLDVGNTFSLNLGSSNTWTALQTFSGSIAIGSTQLVTNLNADLLDGYHASDFVSVGTTGSFLYTASNGITQVGNDFRLGGALTTNTRLNIGNTEVMYFNTSGNVGIGTTSPREKLEIQGNLSFDDLTTGQIGTISSRTPAANRGSLDFYARGNSGSLVNVMTITGNLGAGIGAVGIGTTAPSKKLDVVGDINLTGTIFSNGTSGTSGQVLSSTGTGLQWVNASSVGQTYSVTNGLTMNSNVISLGGTLTQNTTINTSSFNISIGINETSPSLYMSSNGKIGIGTSNPVNTLQIGTNMTGYSNNDIAFGNTNGSTALHNAPGRSWWYASQAIQLYPGGSSSSLYLATTGNVGVGTTNPSYKLDVAGAIRLGQDTSFYMNGASTTINHNGTTWLQPYYNAGYNTAIYSGNSSTSPKMVILAGGNVGIGTTNPTQKLDINGSLNIGGSMAIGSTQLVTNLNADLLDGLHASDFVAVGTTGSFLYTAGTGLTLSNTNVFSLDLASANTWTAIQNLSAGATISNLSVGGTIFTSNLFTTGNLGIGTTAPSKKLDVAGDINLTGTIFSNGTSGTSGQVLSSTGTGLQWVDVAGIGGTYTATNGLTLAGSAFGLGGTLTQNTNLTIGNTSVLFLGTNGNVGIGNTNPSYKLVVTGEATFSSWLTASSVIRSNSGAFRSGTGTNLVLSTGDTAQVTILPSGNLGIGTAVPSKKLDISGDINLTGTIFSNGTSGTSGQVLSSTGTGLQWVNASGVGQTYSATNGLSIASNIISLGGTLTQNTTINTSGFNLNIGQGNTQPLFISAGGNVGIGTTNPLSMLQISSPTSADPTVSIRGTSTNNNAYLHFISRLSGVDKTATLYTDWNGNFVASPNGGKFAINTIANTNTLNLGGNMSVGVGYTGITAPTNGLIIQGNVGIGTTSPLSKLQVNTGTDQNFRVGSYTSELFLGSYNDADSAFRPLQFFATEYNFNSGNVGIGTTAPSKKLDVVGDVNLTGTIFASGTSGTSGQILSSTGTGLQWINPSSIGSTYAASNGLTLTGSTFSLGGTLTQDVRLSIGNTESLFIRHPLGNVGIGMTAPFNKLTVTGTQSNVTLTRTISLSDVGTTAVTAIGSTFTNDDSGRMLVWSNGTTRNIVGVNSTSSQIAYINTAASIGATQSVSVYIPNFYVSDNGRVGINTTDNTAQLTVNGDIVASKFASIYDYSRYYLSPGNASSNTAALSLHGNGSMVFNTETIGGTQVVISASSSTRLKSFVNGFGIATNIGSTAVGAHITWSDSFFVKNNGNVGIGTTDPQARLDIGGTSSTISNTSGDITLNSASNNISFSGDNLINITNGYFSGNVGIGVTNTSSNLEIGTTNSKLTLSTPTTSLAKNTLIGHISGRSTYYNSDIAGIKFEADGTYAGGIYPSRITFFTSANSAGAINLERMRIQENGNVGIGTTNPLYKLTVSGDGLITGKTTIGLGSTNPLYTLNVGGTTAFIDTYTSGNVGIGTASPTNKLHVLGSSNDTINVSNLNVKFQGGGGNGLGFGTQSSAPYRSYIQSGYLLNFGTATYDLLLNPIGGNVGIGTTASTAKLQIDQRYDNGSPSFRLNQPISTWGTTTLFNNYRYIQTDSGATDGNFRQFNVGAGGVAIGYTTTPIYGSSDALYINGNVGIGTTNPGAKVTINGGEGTYAAPTFGSSNLGAINIWSNTSDRRNAITFSSAGGSNAQAGIYVHQDNSSGTHMYLATTDSYATGPQARLTILNNGNVGIGITSPGYKLTVNGQPAANGYTAFTNYSDARLKTNIDQIGDGYLDKIMQLKPSTFNYNDLTGYDEETKSRRITGFIAQELQTVFPDMIGTVNLNGIEYLDTNLSSLSIYSVKAIQELNIKLEGMSITPQGQVNVEYNVSPEILASLGYVDSKNEIESAIYSHKINTGLVKTINLVAQNIIAEVTKSKVTKTDTILPLDDVTDTIAVGGTLVTEELRSDKLTSQEATISTLYANRIISQEGDFGQVMTDKITSLREEIRNVIASIGSTSSIQESTQSAILAEAQGWSYDIGTSQMIITGDMSLSNNLVVGSKLIVVGDTQLGNAFITGTFTAGEIAIKDNLIETTNTALYIQPSGIGSVNIMNNSLVIAENGEVTLNGNLAVGGNVGVSGSLFATLINADEINTKKINVATDSATVVVASAETGFAALATSSAQIDSNATAGIATLPAGKTELVINNNKITSSSIIYLTPAGSTNNQVVYLKSKTIANGPTEATESASPSQSNFTIAIDQALIQDIDINWWIIN